MHKSKLALAVAIASSAIVAPAFRAQSKIKTVHVKPKMKSYVPKMVTANDKEIAAWNAKVEAKKARKKSRR